MLPFLASLIGLAAFLATWLGLVVLARRWRPLLAAQPDWPLALALASTTWGVLATVVVEALSAARQLNAGGVLGAWVLLALAVMLAVRHTAAPAAAKPESGRATRAPAALPRAWVAGLIVAGLGYIAVAVQGLLTAPTAWDALTYHLPRVLHWLQHASVAHYPTLDTRQVESGPWPAFFVQAQLHLLWDTDRLGHLVQWFSFGLAATAAAGLAVRLEGLTKAVDDAGRPAVTGRVPLLAGFLVLTVPACLTQAATPLTDLVVAGWTLVAALLGAELALHPTSRGLALARLRGARRRLRCLAWVALASGLPLLPHFARNFGVFGSPLGSAYVRSVMANAESTPGVVWSGIVRNLALHTPTGIAPVTDVLNTTLAGQPICVPDGLSGQRHPGQLRCAPAAGRAGGGDAGLPAAARAAPPGPPAAGRRGGVSAGVRAAALEPLAHPLSSAVHPARVPDDRPGGRAGLAPVGANCHLCRVGAPGRLVCGAQRLSAPVSSARTAASAAVAADAAARAAPASSHRRGGRCDRCLGRDAGGHPAAARLLRAGG